MRIWVKNFGYHKNKGYQFFESEICTDKTAMEIEEDFKTATQFVSMSEFFEIEKQLSDLQEKYDRAVEFIQDHANKIEYGRERYIQFLKSIEEKDGPKS